MVQDRRTYYRSEGAVPVHVVINLPERELKEASVGLALYEGDQAEPVRRATLEKLLAGGVTVELSVSGLPPGSYRVLAQLMPENQEAQVPLELASDPFADLSPESVTYTETGSGRLRVLLPKFPGIDATTRATEAGPLLLWGTPGQELEALVVVRGLEAIDDLRARVEGASPGLAAGVAFVEPGGQAGLEFEAVRVPAGGQAYLSVRMTIPAKGVARGDVLLIGAGKELARIPVRVAPEPTSDSR